MADENRHRTEIEEAYLATKRMLANWRSNVLPPHPSLIGATIAEVFSVAVAPDMAAVEPKYWVVLQRNLWRAFVLGAASEAVKFFRQHSPGSLAEMQNHGSGFEAAAESAVHALARSPLDPTIAQSPAVMNLWVQVSTIIDILHATVARMQRSFLELPPTDHGATEASANAQR